MHFDDPVTAAWVAAAHGMGFSVRRSPDAWAAYDGQGGITVSDDSGLDADDSAASLILHELSHFLVQGAASASQPDWGLDTVNPGPDEQRRERSAVRIQRAVLLRRGLQDRLAPTTDYRAFYDALGADPIADDPLAQAAWELLVERGWLSILDAALGATAGTPDCGACGACCHRGFGALEIPADDPFAASHAELLEITPDGARLLPRPQGWCPLVVQTTSGRRWACSEYGARPLGCVRFEPGSPDCLDARERAGLSG
jgi:hypothetical protein